MKKLITCIAVMTLTGSLQAADWGYEGVHNPELWGDIASECAVGKNQSPININNWVDGKLQKFDINYTGDVTDLSNNGHTLQATISGENTLTVDNDEFKLLQFHFHTPSENMIKGQQYPLEAHFVHADKDQNLAVIAVMFDAGEKNKELAALAETLPQNGETVHLSHNFAVKDLLPETQSYYRFNGSLTTPPCSEGVRWFVMKKPKTLSTAQANELMDVMGHNNRPIQPMNARVSVLND